MHEYLIRWLLIGPAAPLPRGCHGLPDLPADVLASLHVLAASKRAIAEAWRDEESDLRAAAAQLGIAPPGPAAGSSGRLWPPRFDRDVGACRGGDV